MGMSASKVYLPSDAKAAEINNLALGTHVVLIPYSILLETNTHNPKPPICCRGCEAALNRYSVLHSAEHYYQKMAGDPSNPKSDIEKAEEEKDTKEKNYLKGEYIKDLKSEEVAWICEFCGVHNRLTVDTVLPEDEKQLYLIKKGETTSEKQEKTTEGVNNEDDYTLIFCIDVSGSMGCTHEVENNSKKQYVSRIKLVTEAVLKQIKEMKETSPHVKIGIVLFGANVSLLGDCNAKMIEINNKADLENFEKIFNIGLEMGENLITKSVKGNFSKLESEVQNLNVGGGTALGPGLLSALALATYGKKGSKIILCTDGLANIGLGVLEYPSDLPKSVDFYNRIGDIAVGKGVSISIITIKGQACKVDALAPLTDKTAGQILRVDPTNFDLSSLASNNLIATDVKIKALLHEGLAFQGQEAKDLYNNKSILKKDVGSVSDKNEAYFQYRIKNIEELQLEDINLEELEFLPLQAQISYTDLKGNEYVLVVSRKQDLTKDQKEAEKGIKAEILSNYAEKQSANLILAGRVEEAKEENKRWNQVMESAAANMENDEKSKQLFKEYQSQNQMIQLLIDKNAQGEIKNAAENDDITSQLYAIKQKQSKF